MRNDCLMDREGLKEMAYFSLVRSSLEYAVAEGDPFIQRDVSNRQKYREGLPDLNKVSQLETLGQGWANVIDGGPTVNQRWPNVPCLLG